MVCKVTALSISQTIISVNHKLHYAQWCNHLQWSWSWWDGTRTDQT